MTQTDILDWRLTMWSLASLCEGLRVSIDTNDFEVALDIHNELRSRLAEKQYPQHAVSYAAREKDYHQFVAEEVSHA